MTCSFGATAIGDDDGGGVCVSIFYARFNTLLLHLVYLRGNAGRQVMFADETSPSGELRSLRHSSGSLEMLSSLDRPRETFADPKRHSFHPNISIINICRDPLWNTNSNYITLDLFYDCQSATERTL